MNFKPIFQELFSFFFITGGWDKVPRLIRLEIYRYYLSFKIVRQGFVMTCMKDDFASYLLEQNKVCICT